MVEEGRKRKEKRFENRRGQMRGVRTLCEKLSREKYRRRKRKSSSAGKLRFMLSLCQSVPAQSDHPVRERNSRKSIQRAAALNYIFHHFIPRGKQYAQKDDAAYCETSVGRDESKGQRQNPPYRPRIRRCDESVSCASASRYGGSNRRARWRRPGVECAFESSWRT